MQRYNAVQWALRMTKNTTFEPQLYERQILARFIRGVITLNQAIELLEFEDMKTPTVSRRVVNIQ